ncbi:hypothetical protein M1555_00530 [Patescibacteria group bacterium]|nr:hypothetical protein [Patescibacteria group bacterium]
MLQFLPKYVLFLLFLLFAVNLLFLDIVFFGDRATQPRTAVSRVEAPLDEPSVCPGACTALIAGIAKETTPSAAVSSPVPSQPVKPKGGEFYIPLGSGMTRSTEYAEITGAEATADTGKYPGIRSAVFQVVLTNPTGNGTTYAKLVDVTNKHDVWFSEVSFAGGGTVVKEAPITLDPGNNLYRVALRSTLGYDVYVANARIRIETE